MRAVGERRKEVLLPRVIAPRPSVPRLIVAEGHIRSLYQEFLRDPVPAPLAELANQLVDALERMRSDNACRQADAEVTYRTGKQSSDWEQHVCAQRDDDRHP
jgi:hypothetical protein